MNKSIISTLVLVAALGVGSVHMQQQDAGSRQGQGQGMLGNLLGGLGGGANMGGQQMPGGNLLGGLLGGGRANGQAGPLDSILGGQQGGLLGQNGLLGQGGLLNGLGGQSGGMQGGPNGQLQQGGGLGQMLMQIPQRAIQMVGQLVNGVRNMMPGGGSNANQQLGRAQNQMMPRNPLDTLSQAAGGNNPLNGLTNGLSNTLNGLTSNLPAPLNQLGSNLPNLNGLTNGLTQGNPLEGAARTVNDLGQGLSRTLSNVMPRAGATINTN